MALPPVSVAEVELPSLFADLGGSVQLNYIYFVGSCFFGVILMIYACWVEPVGSLTQSAHNFFLVI